MEFRLNKIDTDIRKKMQEEIKDDKVHSSGSITVKKDIKEERNELGDKEFHEEDKSKRYFALDGIKYNNVSIKVNVEKIEEINEENSKGRVLDTTK